MRLLIIGAGISGAAAAKLVRSLGFGVVVYDRSAEAAAPLRDAGFPVHTGAWTRRHLDLVDGVIVSPGVPEHAQPVVDAREAGAPIYSELEFASRHLDAPYAAVTGTNGKTTVAVATAAMLEAGGMRAVAAGNVGTALSDVVGGAWDVVVIEASSFQLRFIDQFHPRAAAITNIAPDHLDWHGSLASYAAAKARIFENMGPDDLLAYEADDARVVDTVATSNAAAVPFSGSRRPPGGNGPEGDQLIVAGHRFPLPAFDATYTSDLVAAATLAIAMGGAVEGVASVLETFAPGAHRREVVGVWSGVTWVNDSKATNPHAAVAAARAYPSVVLIAGGQNKGLDLAPLTRVETVRRVIAFGEAAGEIAAAGDALVVDTLAQAVASADAIAEPGDVVLLAPGCASFDQFDSYAHRGEVFSHLVRRRKEDAA
jgi:UDP-N-acetylmuramoylalanine--D-glutamate ligase